jgi:uncharacterized repeat protein (TIGR02543 family)
MVLPAYAQGPIPIPPHGFSGAVSTINPPQVVPEGTLVQAFLDGVMKTEDTVDADGRYQLLVKGPGTTVTFKVAGVPANETATWMSGELEDDFNLTIDALPTGAYDLTMAVAPEGAGTATDVSNSPPYAEGVEVNIRAVPVAGYGFVSWTATPEATFNDARATQTYFTMPADDITVTANFGQAYALTTAASPTEGGSAIDVQGYGEYAQGGRVSIRAQAADGYQFLNWSATPDVVFADANAAETTFTMIGQAVTVTAVFESVAYTLTLAASPIIGGTVSAAPAGPYQEGTVITVQAVAASGYQFSHWTAGAGILANPNASVTTFTMPGSDVTVTATFTLVPTGGAVCFIATAAYGTPGAEQIDVLREFRDAVLLESAIGSHFVALYYRLSPPLAEVISGNSFLRTMVRECLVDPLVWMVEATGDIWRE